MIGCAAGAVVAKNYSNELCARLSLLSDTALQIADDMSCQHNKEGEKFAQIMFDINNSQDQHLLDLFLPKYKKLVELESKKADNVQGYVH